MTSLRRTLAASGATLLARPLMALILAATLVGGPASPAYAQAAPQNPPPAPAPQAAPSSVVNSPRIEQFIHDNKLEISLQDAVELALENSVDIAVRRYYPWIADVGILKASSGPNSSGYGIPGAAIPGSSASLNPFPFIIKSYDP